MEGMLRRIEGYRDEIIRLPADLTSKVALGTQNGGTGEHEKADFLKEKLLQLKPDFIDEIKAPDKHARHGYRPNLVARWNGVSDERTLWVLGHTDIVPPGDLSLWNSDPYQIKVEGDRIIGRGVEDNQHGIVSSYLAKKAIVGLGEVPRKPVGLAFVADEETGSAFGLDYILKNHGELFRPRDLIVVPDAGNEQGTMIEVAEKSMLWLRFTVTGKQCHASTPDKGKNSLYGAARLITELDRLRREFPLEDELFRPTRSTFEPTKMDANVPNVNTIPGRDVFHMDCRILPKYPVDAPVVKALSASIRKVTGLEAKPMGIGGGTVAAFFRKAGLPAAVWITESGTPHQPNEFCLISNIVTDAKVFACLYMGD